MAVFTEVSQATLEPWLAQFNVGELQALQGIAAGIENTNYFVTTAQGRFVLTIFEKLTPAQLLNKAHNGLAVAGKFFAASPLRFSRSPFCT